MKVLLISNYASDAQESMVRFADLLFSGLKTAGIQVEMIRPEAVLGRIVGRTASGWAKWVGYLDKFLLFPWRLRRRLAVFRRQLRTPAGHIIHICDHSNAMYAQAVAGFPVVATCHDLLAVRGALGEATDCPASRTGVLLQRWILRGLSRACAIVCDSSATEEDVKRLVSGADRKLISVVHVGMNYPYRVLKREEIVSRLKEVPRLANLAGGAYVLHVGSNALRKNRAALIRIMAILAGQWNGSLVLAGEGLSPELRKTAEELNVLNRIVEVERPDNELLEALYNAASLLVYPSTHEGFGWPLIEAQACGCPVVCSDAGPFKEIVGDSAWRIPVEKEGAFAEAVVKVLHPTARQEWVDKGLENAKRFDPRRMVDRYLEVYKELEQRYQSSN